MSILAQLLQTTLASAFGQSARRHRKSKTCQGDSLESRKLLAAMVNARTLKYQDVDGDSVTVTFNKDVLTNGNVNQIFQFSSGAGAVNGNTNTKEMLQRIDLTMAGPSAVLTSVTTASAKSSTNGGDGYATLGELDAEGIDLGTVTIDGDLGRVLAGDSLHSTQGLGTLTVQSLGKFGTATGAMDLNSVIEGQLLSLKVKTDVSKAQVSVKGGSDGKIGSITIGGSVIGGATTGSGRILAEGAMGTISIQGDLVGGAGSFSGMIRGQETIGNVTIGGTVVGSTGTQSGSLVANHDLGIVIIGGDLKGALGSMSGAVSAGVMQSGEIAGITVNGSTIGGMGNSSGGIYASSGIGQVTIGQDLRGGAGIDSGSITTLSGKIAGVKISGSLIGGGSGTTGSIFTQSKNSDIGSVSITGDVDRGSINANGKLGDVSIGGSLTGSVTGGAVLSAGSMGIVKIGGDMIDDGTYRSRILSSGTLAGITVGGSVVGGEVYSNLNMGAVIVKGDVRGAAYVQTQAGSIHSDGKISSVTIGGALLGTTASYTGYVQAQGDIGSVKIAGDIRGGEGVDSGRVSSLTGKIAGVTVGGSLIGSDKDNTGCIFAGSDIGPVVVAGNVQGGTGLRSGRISTGTGKLGSVSIGGSLLGGAAEKSGSIFSARELENIKISGSVKGGMGYQSGSIIGGGYITSVTLGGSLLGGAGSFSGEVEALHNIGSMNILGSIKGGDGAGSGSVSADAFSTFILGGALQGGSGYGSGFISGSHSAITIKGDIRGGSGESSGQIAGLNIDVLSIGGDIVGGSAAFSGGIELAQIHSLTLTGSLIGGTGSSAGLISVLGEISSATIKGSIIGGSQSGNANLEWTGALKTGRIGKLTVNGSLIAGNDNTSGSYFMNGAIFAKNDIGDVLIKGSIIGNTTHSAKVIAQGQMNPSGVTDLAIGKLTVNHRVELANIAAGTNIFGGGGNADAQIGQVTVGGDWIASNLVAGVIPGANSYFGDGDDTKVGGGSKDEVSVFSTISSISIAGQVIGTPFAVGDHFGFVAENINSLKIGNETYSLNSGSGNDELILGLPFNNSGDIRLNEI